MDNIPKIEANDETESKEIKDTSVTITGETKSTPGSLVDQLNDIKLDDSSQDEMVHEERLFSNVEEEEVSTSEDQKTLSQLEDAQSSSEFEEYEEEIEEEIEMDVEIDDYEEKRFDKAIEDEKKRENIMVEGDKGERLEKAKKNDNAVKDPEKQEEAVKYLQTEGLQELKSDLSISKGLLETPKEMKTVEQNLNESTDKLLEKKKIIKKKMIVKKVIVKKRRKGKIKLFLKKINQ